MTSQKYTNTKQEKKKEKKNSRIKIIAQNNGLNKFGLYEAINKIND